jgi:hypothetical protein
MSGKYRMAASSSTVTAVQLLADADQSPGGERLAGQFTTFGGTGQL